MNITELKPIAKDTLERQVLQRLRQIIVTDGLQPGDRLPGERELAEQLCVSRNTVRGSYAYLEAIGAVSRSPKRGAVLQQVDFTALAEASKFLLVRSERDLADLFVARRLLETSLLPIVAQNATETHFARLEAANRQMEAELDAGGLGAEGDQEFHQTLLDAAGNVFLTLFGTLIHAFFQDPRTRFLLNPESNRKTIADHREIVECLRRGDSDGAQATMLRHLTAYVDRGVVAEEAVEQT